MLQQVLDGQFTVSARHIARLTGSLSSMGLALGPIVRLWTRELYRTIQQSVFWDQKIQLSEEAQNKILFWCENFENSGQPIWSASPKIEVLTYSDAFSGLLYSLGVLHMYYVIYPGMSFMLS